MKTLDCRRAVTAGVCALLCFGLLSITGCSMVTLMLYSHDTVVSVASQLPGWVQEQARRIYGFDLDHTGILADEEAAGTYLRILDEASEGRAARATDR